MGCGYNAGSYSISFLIIQFDLRGCHRSLPKAVYKPAAFFKGILLPLAAAGNCTLQEGTIFASVLARVSIPGNHSAVALLKV